MKKILIIEDWESLTRKIGQIIGGHLLEKKFLAATIILELAKHELKDVVEIKTFAKEFYGKRLGVDLPELSKDKFKAGDSLLVYVGKQSEKEEK